MKQAHIGEYFAEKATLMYSHNFDNFYQCHALAVVTNSHETVTLLVLHKSILNVIMHEF
jgi:hypothetical protein